MMCFNFFVFMFIISGLHYIPISTCQVDVLYKFCARRFQCGNFITVDYPFWGGDRPPHCGHPDFRIDCQGDVSLITLRSMQYRVLGVDTGLQLITLARQDLWNNTCPIFKDNTDLDYGLFRHAPGDENLTLSYDCPVVPGQQDVYQFNCTQNGIISDSFFFTRAAASRTQNIPQLPCRETITVPINQTSVQLLTNYSSSENDLREALNAGFGLIWEANDTSCNECSRSGGRCGYNSSTSSFACYCYDRPYPSLCNVTDSGIGHGNNSKLQISKILGTVLAVVGFVIGCLVIFAYKKQKKLRTMEGEQFSNQNAEEFVRNYEALTTLRYSYSDIKKMTNSFKEKLGQGGYGGRVYKGKIANGRLVAVKVLNETQGKGEEFINEVASISRTSHVNVVTLLGFCFERNNQALIYEFMPNKSLDKFLCDDHYQRSPDSSQLLDSNILYKITVGIARGLEYLHRGCNTRIVHFDIKPQNILLDEDFCPKISDFGLAKLCKKK
ncbi:hypothetical protein AgCh_037199 [Apium graveolens]